MALLNELLELNEASAAGRAWAGRLEKIDALLFWMYEKDILTKTEKDEKDKVFRQYYRYYNDGDMPGFLKNKGISKYSGREKIEKSLEEYIEGFIKKILAKYLSKVDRTDFRIDNTIKALKTVQDIAKNEDAHGLLTYWLKKTKIKDDDGELAVLVNDLHEKYYKTEAAATEADPESENTVLSYRRVNMKKNKTWTKDMERSYAEMAETCAKIANFVGNIIAGLEKFKKLHAIEKE